MIDIDYKEYSNIKEKPTKNLGSMPYVKFKEMDLPLENIFTLRNYINFGLNYDLVFVAKDLNDIKKLETLVELIELNKVGFISDSVFSFGLDLIINQFSRNTPALILERLGIVYNGNFKSKDSFYKYRDNLWYNCKYPAFKSAITLSKDKTSKIGMDIVDAFDNYCNYWDDSLMFSYFIVKNVLSISKSKSYISNSLASFLNSVDKVLINGVFKDFDFSDFIIKDVKCVNRLTVCVEGIMDSLIEKDVTKLKPFYSEVIDIVNENC